MPHERVSETKIEKNDAPMLINAEEFARILGVSPRTLWRLLSARKLIQPIRIGGNTRWRFDEVIRWIESGCKAPSSDTLS